MNSSDRILVTALVGTAANGLYAAAYKIPSILTVFSGIFTQAWFFSAMKEEERDDRDKYTGLVFQNLLYGMMFIAGVLLVFLKPIMWLYVGAKFYDSWRYSPFLIVGFIFMTTGTFVATPYMVHKDSIRLMLSSVCGAVANVVLNFMLIPVIGANGAAISTCISYFAVFLYRAIDTRRYIKMEMITRTNIMAFSVLCLMVGTVYWDSFWGIVLLLAELTVLLFILRKFMIELSSRLTHIFKKRALSQIL